MGEYLCWSKSLFFDSGKVTLRGGAWNVSFSMIFALRGFGGPEKDLGV